MGEKYDVIIIGAGIAGLTAALYSARQRLKTLVISIDLGGQLLLAPELQNFPGFISISGLDLIKRVEEQARLYGSNMVFDQVTGISPVENGFEVSTLSGSKYLCDAIILAFGKTPKELGVPGEKKLKGKGVSYCVICDSPLFTGKDVVLVSWGYHGAEGAIRLRDYARKVYWVFPGEKPVDDEAMLQEVLRKGNVELIPYSEIVEIVGDEKVEAVVIRNKKASEERKLEVSGIFVEIGYVTKTDFIKDLVELNEKGEIVVDEYCRTSREGIFAAGDVTEMPFKQAVIAAGMGACAALSAYNYIMKLRGKKAVLTADWRHLSMPGKEKEKEGRGLFLKLK